MRLGILIFISIVLWVISGIIAFYGFESLDQASNFGESFGAISSLFSSFALALAIYSMVLQQKQNDQFEKYTLTALDQQSKQIEIINKSIEEQLKTAKVAAITALIDREEQRIANLKEWGEQKGDINKYENGIAAASRRIEKYNEDLQAHATC
ncbi:hypothetical protein Misp06_02883 [Microbulbifer sp. NBRC 101763]|uniref:hypothetical protein n=1 Tax=Microbulbifer sp. NBRC 101763 TaxID=1113820 RepID=UPI0030A14E7B